MSTPAASLAKQLNLRVDAEARLKEGSAPPTHGWSASVSALSLLHKLASTTASADDALKLLHELQVHQVELDMQHEQMEATRRELAEDLTRYQGLYEFAPVTYLNVGPEGDIFESNVAGAGLLAVEQDELRGRRLQSFLTPESRPVLLEWLKQLGAGGSPDTCEVQLSAANLSRPLQIVARVAPGGGSFLLIILDTTDRGQPDPRV